MGWNANKNYAIGLSYFTINNKKYTLSVVFQRSYRENNEHPDDFAICYAKIWTGTRNDVDFDTNEGYIAKIEKNLNAKQDYDSTKIVYTSDNFNHWYSVHEGAEGGDGSDLLPKKGNR